MDFALYARSNELMSAALNGEIGLDDLEIELVSMIVELDPRCDASTEMHIASALLVLAELERGDRSVESLRRTLRALIAEGEASVSSRAAASTRA